MIPTLVLSLIAPALTADPVPPNAVTRLGPDRFTVEGVPDRFVVSPDGRRVATGEASGNVIKVWDTTTGQAVAEYPGVTPLAYSPDGKTLAANGPADARAGLLRAVVLFDTETGRPKLSLPGHRDPVEFAAYAGNDVLIVAAVFEKDLHVWDLNTRTEVRTIPRSRTATYSHRKGELLSPDGKFLILVDAASNTTSDLHVFVASTGEEHVVRKGIAGVSDLGFTPDGKTLICRGENIARYTFPECKPAGEVKLARGYRPNAPHVFTADGYYQAFSSQDKLWVYDLVTGREVGIPLKVPVFISGRPGPTDVFIDASTSRLEVWDLTTGKPRHPTAGHRAAVTGVTLAAGGCPMTADESSVRFWSPTGEQEKIWSTPLWSPVLAAASSADGKQFRTASRNRIVRSWDVATSRTNDLTVPGQAANWLDFPGFSRDGSVVAYPGPHGLAVFDVVKARQLWTASPPAGRVEFTVAAVSADGKTVYTGDANGHIREWDGGIGKEVRRFVGQGLSTPGLGHGPPGRPAAARSAGHVGSVTGLAVGGDNRRLLSAGTDHSIRVWELVTGQECRVLIQARNQPTNYMPKLPYPLAVSDDGSTLAAPDPDETRRHVIDLWNVRTGARIGSLDGHRGPVTALAFSADGTRLISGGADTTAFVWTVPREARSAAATLDRAKALSLWADLADGDAAKAYQALGLMVDAPDTAVAVLRENLPAVKSVDAVKVAALIAGLDAALFADREKAQAELRDLGPAVKAALEAERDKTASAEVTRRIGALLTGLSAGSEHRRRRVVEVAEAVGTPAAIALLKDWANGEPSALLTKDSVAALARLERRKSPTPGR
jgi:WD40 repeat protein